MLVTSARRALLAAISTALLMGLAWGCAASSVGNGDRPAGGGGSPGIGEAGTDAQFIQPEGSVGDADGTLGLNPLCGKAPLSVCVPDLVTACRHYVPPARDIDASVSSSSSSNSNGGATGADQAAGASGEAGAAGQGSGGMSGAAGAAGASPDAGAAGAVAVVGAAGATGGGSLSFFGCQVQRAAVGAKVVAQCDVAVPDLTGHHGGPGGIDGPCLTSNDCQAGLGCVGDQKSGLCEQYCCKDADSCGKGTYCAERPMRDALTNARGAASRAPMIPVCVPAENCDLSTPYPCGDAAQCACSAGTACVVVRSDGTTTCAVPGAGVAGESCPCAWGHVCSAATAQCLKLCFTRGAPSCGTGKCQSSAELPDGWGVCIGG